MTAIIQSSPPLTSAPLAAKAEPTEASVASSIAESPAAQPLPDGAVVSAGTLGALLAEQKVSVLDFSGQDLRAIDLRSLDLRGANLSGSDLSGMDLSGLDFTGADLTGAKLAGAVLTNARLANVTAQGADLSDAVLANADLNGSDFSRARFDGAYFGPVPRGEPLPKGAGATYRPTGLKLDGASFAGASFTQVQFAKTSAVDADFSNIVADRLSFDLSNLQAANFDGASGASLSFSFSDLTGAEIINVTALKKGFTATQLNGTRFEGTPVSYTRFNHTDLSVADIGGVPTDARFVEFAATNLDGLDFSGFNLYGSVFESYPISMEPLPPERVPVEGAGSSFRGTKFDGANLSYAKFDNVEPKGSSHDDAIFDRTLVGNLARSSLAREDGVRELNTADGWAIEEFLWLQAERSNPQGDEINVAELTAQGARWYRNEKLNAEEDARRAGGDVLAVEPVPTDGVVEDRLAAASAKHQAAASALETLKAIRDQIDEANERTDDASQTPPEGPYAGTNLSASPLLQ